MSHADAHTSDPLMHSGEPLTLEVQGLRLGALAWGPEDGVPVLAFHGWMDNAATFSALAPRLEGARVVALDLPGHGQSQHRPPGAFYHYIDWLPDAWGAMEALGWSRCVLMGHSMGAGIAALLAGACPERAERLVMLEGLGPLTTPPEEAPGRLRRALEATRTRAARRPRVYPDLDAAVARLMHANKSLGPDAARALVARNTRPGPDGQGVCFAHDPRLRDASRVRLTEPQVEAFLSAVACPTRIVRARQGWSMDAERTQRRVACLKHARVHEVPGGHHAHLTHAEATAAAIAAFVRGAPEDAPSTGAS